MDMDFNSLSRQDLYNKAKELYYWEEKIVDSLLILPNKLKHDSWYGCFDIFGYINETDELFVWKWRSDALHIEGLGNIKFSRLNMDVLYKSKAIRYFWYTKFDIRWWLSDVWIECVLWNNK